MKVYLMQHGRPVSKDENPERPLSAEGISDLRKMGRFLAEKGISYGSAFHSGKQRARESAEILSALLVPGVEPSARQGLSPKDDIRAAVSLIENQEEDILIAGHLPHLSKLAAFLVCGRETPPVVGFMQGGVLCLEKTGEGCWQVSWYITPGVV
jgi:phosphohistidine phosphatase